jgi:hypothetical protein
VHPAPLPVLLPLPVCLRMAHTVFTNVRLTNINTMRTHRRHRSVHTTAGQDDGQFITRLAHTQL